MIWRVAQPLQQGSLYVLLFLLPFSKAIVSIAFGLLLLGWVLERWNPATRNHTVWASPRLRPLALAIGAYLAVCVLSIAVSDFPMLSLHGIRKWARALLSCMLIVEIATQPRVVGRGLKVPERSAIVIACSSALVIIEAVTQELFGKGVFLGHPIGLPWGFQRMIGPYENPIDLATYLMVVIPILLALMVTHRTWARWAFGTLLLALLACLARTEATGALIGLAVGLLAFVGANRTMRRYGLTLLVGLVLVGAFFLQRGDRLASALSGRDVGTRDRWVMWQAALGMIRDRPILGHGVNTFMANYLRYWVGGERQPRYAHNCFLQVAAETGILGLATFLWLLGTLAWLWWRAVHALKEQPPSGEILLGLGAGLLAFLVQSAIDTNFYSLRQAALFWTLSGLTIGLATTILQRNGEAHVFGVDQHRGSCVQRGTVC